MRILDDLKALGPQSRKGTGYWLRNLAPDGSAFSALKLQRPPLIVTRWTQTLAYSFGYLPRTTSTQSRYRHIPPCQLMKEAL